MSPKSSTLNSTLDLEHAQLSDPGKVRAHNEDYIGFSAPFSAEEARNRGWLFVLADGVGGHDRGEVASRAAVESVVAGFRDASVREPLLNVIPKLVRAANSKVIETALAVGSGRSKMATTIVACALRFDRAIIAHVGDSRCYLIRRGNALQLTRDHTVTSEQIRLGLLTAGEAAQASTRHLLSRSLGNDLFVTVDTAEHHVLPEDALLLCSDGLHNSVGAIEMTEALRAFSGLDAAAQSLIALAKQRDGGDNISVQLIRIRSVERMGMYRGRPYKLR